MQQQPKPEQWNRILNKCGFFSILFSEKHKYDWKHRKERERAKESE